MSQGRQRFRDKGEKGKVEARGNEIVEEGGKNGDEPIEETE